MIRTLISAVCLLALANVAPAKDAPLGPEEEKLANQLLGQLGSPSFKARESASARLVQFGRAVEPILRKGLASSDAETRKRCQRLLPLAQQYELELKIRDFRTDKNGSASPLPSWARFKQLAGDDEAARELFIDMHRIDGLFMEELDQKPAALRDKFTNRCMEFMQSLNWNPNGLASTQQLAFMLFAALEPKVTNNSPAISYFSNGLNMLSTHPGGKESLRGDPVIRKLLVKFLLNTDSSAAYNNISLVANLELKEGADIARNLIKLPNRDNWVKMTAIALLGKIGGKSDIAEIEPFLKDKTNFGSVQFGNGIQISAQVRDVALGSLVQLTGQNLADYNFPYLKMFGGGAGGTAGFQFHTSPTMLGFSDEATRNAAHKKWQDWREKDKSQEKKP